MVNIRNVPAEADLNAGSRREVRISHFDGCAAVILRMKLKAPVSGKDLQPAIRRRDGPHDDAQAVAERAARRLAEELGRRERPADREHPADGFRRSAKAWTVVLNE